MLGLSVLLGVLPLSAAETVIRRGIDVFTTAGNGKTYFDFSYDPIPAGFFCKSSKAFTGKVPFKGLPLTTDPPGQLLGADTVVERLTDATFDDRGIATTRLRFRALSMVSIAPIKTACGAFHVYVSLAGQQRVTTMSIFRTQEGGGSFVAPIAVDARITFIPVKPPRDKSARRLELIHRFTFPAMPIPWSLVTGLQKGLASVVIDTDGDLIPDTQIPGTSNFAAGQFPDSFMNKEYCSCCPTGYTCHDANGEQHCVNVTMCPGTQNCC
jgi:hypothetical protein